MVGIIFSARTLYAYKDILFSPAQWGWGAPADLLYLANSPEVLFSALSGFVAAFYMAQNQKKYIVGLLILILSFIPIVAMTLMAQRAGLGAILLFILINATILFYARPKITLIFIAPFLLMAWWFIPVIDSIMATLVAKTYHVGLNARAEEWRTVFTLWTGDIVHFTFGFGWGARLENPAVGGLSVNYTHSFISALLFKTGLLGAATFSFLGGMALKNINRQKIKENFALFLAVLAPMIISIFLYASYKSLGFGLILLIFAFFQQRIVERNQSFVS